MAYEDPDPFDVLGLTPPASELEIRQAYARLSKQRPDDIERFRRAYEDALSRMHWSIYEPQPEPEREPGSGDEPASDDDSDAERALELPIEQLTERVRQPHFAWSALRFQRERWAAIEVFSLRVQTFLMEGEVERAVAEVSSEEVRAEVAQVADSVLLAARWSEALEQLDREQPIPRGLRRFCELFGSVGHAYRKPLVAELAAELASSRMEVLRALDRMHRADPRLLVQLQQATEGLVYGEELAYDDLAEREREYVARAMERVSGRLVPRTGPRRWPRVALGTGIGGLAWLAVGGFNGLLLGTGVVIIVVINEALKGLGDHMHATRDHIADAVVETGLSPDRMLEWLRRQQRPSAEPVNPLGFDAGIADDLALHTLARLARICLRWQS